MLSNAPVHFTVFINIGLAFIPFVLAYLLFKRPLQQQKRHHHLIWWLGVCIYVLFLPNSAYTLTDIIHYFAAAKSPDVSTAQFWLILTPLYLLYFIVCFEFYVISITWGKQYFSTSASPVTLNVLTVALQALIALGVYLGRFQRLESYDIINKPQIIFQDIYQDLTSLNSLMIIAGLFVFYTVFYYLFCYINNAFQRRLSHRLATNV
ncbi:DUF1361 domain-containing protein [Thalassotalea fusca]